MNRRQFVKIAEALKARVGSSDSTHDFDAGYDAAIEAIANDLADICEIENNQFDRARFLAAAGMSK